MKIIDFLKKSVNFYVATVEKGKPKLRPFSAPAEFEGKLYINTNKHKKVFKQILKNPYAALSCTLDDKWIRIEGKLVVDDRREAKQAVLNSTPYLKDYFNADTKVFKVLYFTEGTATINSFNSAEEPEVITL